MYQKVEAVSSESSSSGFDIIKDDDEKSESSEESGLLTHFGEKVRAFLPESVNRRLDNADIEGASYRFRKCVECLVFQLRLIFHLSKKFAKRCWSYSWQEVTDTFIDTVYVWHRFIFASFVFFTMIRFVFIQQAKNELVRQDFMLKGWAPNFELCNHNAIHDHQEGPNGIEVMCHHQGGICVEFSLDNTQGIMKREDGLFHFFIPNKELDTHCEMTFKNCVASETDDELLDCTALKWGSRCPQTFLDYKIDGLWPYYQIYKLVRCPEYSF